MSVVRLIFGVAVIASCAGHAFAQAAAQTASGEGETPHTQSRSAESQPRSNWRGSIGTAVIATPRYPGSDEFRVLPFPLVRVTYRERLYFGPSTTGSGMGGGWYAIKTPVFAVALEGGFQMGRPADRADALAGMEDRDLVGTVGVNARYRKGPIEAIVGVAAGLNDDAGILGTAEVSHTRRIGRRFVLTVKGSVELADEKQMRRDFGVTEIEADRRGALIAAGDPRLFSGSSGPYQPEAGLRQAGVTVSAAYILSPRWTLIGVAGVDGLSDTAAASPLVRRRAQTTAGAGIAWRF